MTTPPSNGPPKLDGQRTWTALKRCLSLLQPAERRRWGLLIPLALLAAGLEAGGAVLIFTLIRYIAAPETLSDSVWLRRFRDGLGLQDEGQFLIAFSAAVAAFYFVKNATLIFQAYYTAKSAGLSVDSLAKRLLRGYLFAPYSMHLTRNSAELIRNTNEAVVTAYRNMLMAVVHATSEASLLAALVAVLVFAAPTVTMIAIGGVALIILVFLKLTQSYMATWGHQSHTLYAKMLSHLHQSLGGVKEVKVLGREHYFIDSYVNVRAHLTRLTWRRNTLENAPRLAMETFFVFAVVVVILVFEHQGSSREVVPVLGLFAYTGFRMLPGLHRIVAYINVIRFGNSAIEDIYADAVQFGHLGTDLSPGSSPRLAFESSVEMRNLTFTYDRQRGPALRDISLSIRRGESLGIVGTTGAGKSTFVDLLLGLLEPESGEVLVDGVDIQTNLRGWRANIGYVPQTIYLVDDTLQRNIALGIEDGDIDTDRVKAAAQMAQLTPLLNKIPEGMQTQVGEHGVRLSGGERQRIAIARALYHAPEVLIFDEATSNLDNKTEREITGSIESLRGDRTIIIIAHRLSTVKNCDRIIMLDEGGIVAQGPYEDLLRDNENFRALAQHV